MPRFLTQPPPAAIAILNAVVGLLMPAMSLVALLAVIGVWSEKSYRLGLMLLPALVACSAAVAALVACAGLAWATPAGKQKSGLSYLLVAVSFAVSAAIVSTIVWFNFPKALGGPVAFALVITGCGAAMAWTMAIASRNFGAKAYLPPLWITVAGAVLAGTWTGLSFALDPGLLIFLPMLWLAAITFACLKS